MFKLKLKEVSIEKTIKRYNGKYMKLSLLDRCYRLRFDNINNTYAADEISSDGAVIRINQSGHNILDMENYIFKQKTWKIYKTLKELQDDI